MIDPESYREHLKNILEQNAGTVFVVRTLEDMLKTWPEMVDMIQAQLEESKSLDGVSSLDKTIKLIAFIIMMETELANIRYRVAEFYREELIKKAT